MWVIFQNRALLDKEIIENSCFYSHICNKDIILQKWRNVRKFFLAEKFINELPIGFEASLPIFT